MKTTSEMFDKALEILTESDICPGNQGLKEAGYVPAGEDGCGPCVGGFEERCIDWSREQYGKDIDKPVMRKRGS